MIRFVIPAVVPILILACYAPTSAVPQEPQNSAGVSFALEFDDSMLELLRKGEQLKTLIPEHLRGKINKVELRPAGNFNQGQTQSTEFQPSQWPHGSLWKENRSHLTIILSLNHLALIKDRQSFSMPITNASNLKTISFECDASKALTFTPGSRSQFKDGQSVVQTVPGAKISGKIMTPEKLKFDSAYGEIELDWSEIESINLVEKKTRSKSKTSSDDESDQPTFLVVVGNGDRLTGQPTTSTIEMTTSWGKATVNLKDCQSLWINGQSKEANRRTSTR